MVSDYLYCFPLLLHNFLNQNLSLLTCFCLSNYLSIFFLVCGHQNLFFNSTSLCLTIYLCSFYLPIKIYQTILYVCVHQNCISVFVFMCLIKIYPFLMLVCVYQNLSIHSTRYCVSKFYPLFAGLCIKIFISILLLSVYQSIHSVLVCIHQNLSIHSFIRVYPSIYHPFSILLNSFISV